MAFEAELSGSEKLFSFQSRCKMTDSIKAPNHINRIRIRKTLVDDILWQVLGRKVPTPLLHDTADYYISRCHEPHCPAPEY
jgi:hypothetical protein